MKILRMVVLFFASTLAIAKGSTQVQVSITAYNSLPAQTDGDPFITATGTRTRMGVIAVSRDILRQVGYNATARIVRFIPSKGCDSRIIPSGYLFRVEDTTAARLQKTVDVWLATRSEALQLGRCTAVMEFIPARTY